ncbi:hypothetical protein F8A87_08215 [Betaproteobacteria bacterium SCN2]|jgi:hypothetical protein|nr:hypothetical protein F8A87_08215 [Betaproteobacteria bacterium SCN2]
MNDNNIVDAIAKARPGVAKYLAIMDCLYSVNVSQDQDFQTQYKGFYRVRQKSPDWYSAYFNLLEEYKGKRPSFSEILDSLSQSLGNGVCEASFSSKLVATLDPWQPIWDKYVLKNTGHKAPASKVVDKNALAKKNYASIQAWYINFLNSTEGKRWIFLFNENIDDYWRLTDIKKVDFILWQTRSEVS